MGQPAPPIDLPCVTPPHAVLARTTLADYRGRWLTLLFYPRDFSFVCPTELAAFSTRLPELAARECDLLAVSVDDLESHRRWMLTPAAEGGVAGLRFPMASDADGEVSRQYGVLDPSGVALRGLFLIDPGGVLQYAVVHNLNVGRNTDEVLRVLDALRAGGLCAEGWTRTDGTIDPRLDLREGRVLGNCRIEKLLGEGGFGWVYSAWDLRLDRRVAVKVGRSTASSTRKAVLREARTAAHVSHGNICTIYSVEEVAGVPVIVMEHLAGGSLAERLEDGPLPRDDAERTARQVIAALVASHAAGVVHGDIKPGNILFNADHIAKIVDFGMARSPLRAEPSTGAIGGTPSYMAPEQTVDGSVSAASDVFSTALLLYEIFTGERVFHGQARDVFARVRSFDPVPLAAGIPENHREVWTRMLARDPDQRPSMAEVEREWKR